MKSFIESIGMVGCSLIILVAVVFGGGVLYVVYLNTLGVAQMNAQRQVTTHSQQYVQTHQQVLVNMYSDWLIASDDAHKNAARLQICAESVLLDPVEWPPAVTPFIQSNCN